MQLKFVLSTLAVLLFFASFMLFDILLEQMLMPASAEFWPDFSFEFIYLFTSGYMAYRRVRLKYYIGYALLFSGMMLMLNGVVATRNVVSPPDFAGLGHQAWMGRLYPEKYMSAIEIQAWKERAERKKLADDAIAKTVDAMPLQTVFPAIYDYYQTALRHPPVRDADRLSGRAVDLDTFYGTVYRRMTAAIGADKPLPILIFIALFGGALSIASGALVLKGRFFSGQAKTFAELAASYPVFEGFDVVYREKMLPWLQEQETKRIAALRARHVCYLLGVPAIIYLFFNIGGFVSSILGTVFLSWGMFHLAERKISAVKREVKNQFARCVAKFLDLSYRVGDRVTVDFSSLEKLDILPAFNYAQVGDIFAGAYRDAQFRICKVNLSTIVRRYNNTSRVDVFDGAVVHLVFPEAFKGTTKILKDRGMILNAVKAALNRTQHKFNLGRRDLEKVFEGYTDNAAEAERLVTPEMIENMAKLSELLSGDISVQAAFSGNEAVIAIDWVETLFNLEMWTPLTNPERICHFAEGIGIAYRLIDIILQRPKLLLEAPG